MDKILELVHMLLLLVDSPPELLCLLKLVLCFMFVHCHSALLMLIFRSMLARDLQSIVLYDQEGKFVGVRRPNSKLPIDIDSMKIIIEDAIGSSGLELKVWTQKSRYSMNFFQLRDSYMELNLFFVQTDPGVPVVYAGFGALMLTTCLSYLSHSQVRIMFTC
jgi:hypothetical protein